VTDADRRTFLIRTTSVLSGLTALRFVPGGLALGQDSSQSSGLHALGHAVLPSELGPEGRDRVVAQFQAWLREFPGGVELSPGWGSAAIRHGPPDPGPRWTAQLEDLQEAARREFQTSFATLSRAQQLSLVSSELSGIEVRGVGSPAEARHVALGLLAFFYRTPEATNLCYRAEIHPEACRPLATAGEKPAPIGRI
jgi:hypothetical protein